MKILKIEAKIKIRKKRNLNTIKRNTIKMK